MGQSRVLSGAVALPFKTTGLAVDTGDLTRGGSAGLPAGPQLRELPGRKPIRSRRATTGGGRNRRKGPANSFTFRDPPALISAKGILADARCSILSRARRGP